METNQVERGDLKKLLISYLEGSEKEPADFSTITDMPKLISYRENTSSGSEPEKLIESRMAEVLESVSLDNIPEWFG